MTSFASTTNPRIRRYSKFVCYMLLVKSGTNEITRTSAQSSVMIPFNVTFRDLERVPNTSTEQGAADASRSNFVFCGCGWPDHMLVPKGTADGLPGILFVMVTDFENDKVA